jgi:hypothetical protein
MLSTQQEAIFFMGWQNCGFNHPEQAENALQGGAVV